jgi:hypothetical protein
VDHNYQAGTQPLPEPTTPEGDEDGKWIHYASTELYKYFWV